MCQIKAPIAGNSKAIAKIGNAELVHFNKQMLNHELIRGSLSKNAALANYSSINLLCFGILFPLFQSFLTARDNVLNKMSLQPLKKPGKSIT
jgi:hypothetical protein